MSDLLSPLLSSAAGRRGRQVVANVGVDSVEAEEIKRRGHGVVRRINNLIIYKLYNIYYYIG